MSVSIIVDVKRLAKNVKLPKLETNGATAMDIACYFIHPDRKGELDIQIFDELGVEVDGSYCYDRHSKCLVIPSGYVVFFRTYLSISYSPQFAMQIDCRSSSAKKRYRIANTRAHIDSDYTGQIYIPIHNWGKKNLLVQNGTKLVQMYLQRLNKIKWNEVQELNKTKRGAGGFGSTSKDKK